MSQTGWCCDSDVVVSSMNAYARALHRPARHVPSSASCSNPPRPVWMSGCGCLLLVAAMSCVNCLLTVERVIGLPPSLKATSMECLVARRREGATQAARISALLSAAGDGSAGWRNYVDVVA
jgi:hypothetical protein